MHIPFPLRAKLAVSCGEFCRGETISLTPDLLYRLSEHIDALRIGPIKSQQSVDLDMVFQYSMPRLTALTLKVNYSDCPERLVPSELVRSFDIPAGRVPRLSSLVLDGVRVSLLSPIYRQLTHLELRDKRGQGMDPSSPSFNLGYLLQTLSACASLKELTIYGYLSGGSFEPPSRVYTLPRLESLNVRDSSPRIAAFMQYLHLPAATSISLTAGFLRHWTFV